MDDSVLAEQDNFARCAHEPFLVLLRGTIKVQLIDGERKGVLSRHPDIPVLSDVQRNGTGVDECSF